MRRDGYQHQRPEKRGDAFALSDPTPMLNPDILLLIDDCDILAYGCAPASARAQAAQVSTLTGMRKGFDVVRRPRNLAEEASENRPRRAAHG
jgi:hypothetical protein